MTDDTGDRNGRRGERNQQLSAYVKPEVKEQLKREAEQEDVPLSEYIRQLIQRARLEDTEEQLARDLNAEERLLELIAEGKDEMAQMAEQVERQNQRVEELLAKTGSYSVVNFQLLKAAHDPSESHVTEWFDTANRRLKADVDATDPYGPAGAGTETGIDTNSAADADADADADSDLANARSFADELQ